MCKFPTFLSGLRQTGKLCGCSKGFRNDKTTHHEQICSTMGQQRQFYKLHVRLHTHLKKLCPEDRQLLGLWSDGSMPGMWSWIPSERNNMYKCTKYLSDARRQEMYIMCAVICGGQRFMSRKKEFWYEIRQSWFSHNPHGWLQYEWIRSRIAIKLQLHKTELYVWSVSPVCPILRLVK